MDTDVTYLSRRDERRVIHQNPELAVRDPGDYQVRLAVEDRLLRRDDAAEELAALAPLLGHASLLLRTRRSARSQKGPRPGQACPSARTPRRRGSSPRLRLSAWPSRRPRLCCRPGRRLALAARRVGPRLPP